MLSIETYGFRGEALYAICSIGTITVTSKTNKDQVAKIYHYDSDGNITDSKPTHQGNGTTITVSNLFRDLPVRKQTFKSTKSQKDELKKIEDLLMSFALIYNNVRITLRNNKKEIWRKNRTSSLSYSIQELFKSKVMQELDECKIDGQDFKIYGFIPKKNCNVQTVGRSMSDRIFVFVNKRPVVMTTIKKVVYSIYFSL